MSRCLSIFLGLSKNRNKIKTRHIKVKHKIQYKWTHKIFTNINRLSKSKYFSDNVHGAAPRSVFSSQVKNLQTCFYCICWFLHLVWSAGLPVWDHWVDRDHLFGHKSFLLYRSKEWKNENCYVTYSLRTMKTLIHNHCIYSIRIKCCIQIKMNKMIRQR